MHKNIVIFLIWTLTLLFSMSLSVHGFTSTSISNINGNWINKKYVSLLKRERSIDRLCKSLITNEPLSGISFSAKNDTILITLIWGLSEGVIYTTQIEDKKDLLVIYGIENDGSRANFNITFNKKKNVVLFHDGTHISEFIYTGKDKNEENTLEELFNQIIFSGAYKTKDKKYIFEKNGNLLINEKSFKYRTIIDCTFLNKNILQISNDTLKSYYVFKRTSNSLTLYPVDISSDDIVWLNLPPIKLKKTN
jgi:hypothetical protein